MDTSHVVFSSSGEVFAKKNFSKGQLTLVPCTDSESKIIAEPDQENPKVKAFFDKEAFVIQAPKALKQSKGIFGGFAVPYWMCGASADGQMSEKKLTKNGVTFVRLQNEKPIKANEKIMVKEVKEEVDMSEEEPKPKRPKRA